jgi:hypothetical protein
MKICESIVQTEFSSSVKKEALNRDKEPMYSILITKSIIEISDK